MQYFKHYSGVKNSESLSVLEDKLGFAGIGRYWRMLEYLVENFDGDSPTFRIHRRNVRELLRLRSWNDCGTFMECFGNVRGIFVNHSENVYEIDAPILLELQSRDFKRARTDRASSAPKIKSKNKIKNKEEDKEKENKTKEKVSELDEYFEIAKAFWKEATGTGAMANAKKKIANHINSPEKKESLLEAIKNYGEVLKVETDRPIKTSLDTFIGSPERGLYYLDYIDVGCVDDARKRASRKNSVASQKKTKNQQLLENHQILFEKIERGEL